MMRVRTLVGVLSLLLSLVATGCAQLILAARTQPLEETVVLGKSGPKIAQIEIKGLITDSRPRSGLLQMPRESLVARVKESLDRAEKDSKVVALLLRIQSPGGTVSASETLYHEVAEWKKRTGRPVIAHLEGIAASGAYYVAMAADEVIAHPTTVTGSIGVLFSGLNLSGLMEKVGIENQTLTGGSFKDAGSPFRPMQPEERAQLQSVIDDFHARFQEVVELGRPALGGAAVARLSDGRIFSARQALEAGLVDRLGYLGDAVEAIEARVGIDDSRVVVYHRPHEYRSNLYSGAAATATLDLNVLPAALDPVPTGFYYLWPAVLGSR